MSMEEAWVAHLDSLADRVRRNDPSLTHLEPCPRPPSQAAAVQQPEAITKKHAPPNNQKQQTKNQQQQRGLSPSSALAVGSASRMWSLFHMMILLDDPSVQAALERLWEACYPNNSSADTHQEEVLLQASEAPAAEATLEAQQEELQPKEVVSVNNQRNTHIRRVTLPSMWPCSDLRQALAACVHLEGLQEVRIVPQEEIASDNENHKNDNAEEIRRPSGSTLSSVPTLWSNTASPLMLQTDLFPLLQAAVDRMEQQQQHRRGRSESGSSASSLSGASSSGEEGTASAARVSLVSSSPYTYPGLVHLELDTRVMARTQDEINQLGRLVVRLTSLQTLALQLVVPPPPPSEQEEEPRIRPFAAAHPQQQAALAATTNSDDDDDDSSNQAGPHYSLDPIFHAAADLSRNNTAAASVTGLVSLTLQWYGESTNHDTSVVSVQALTRLLLHLPQPSLAASASTSGTSSFAGSSQEEMTATTTASTLHTLHLENCRLADAHLHVVAKALEQPDSSLRHLHLSGHGVPGRSSRTKKSGRGRGGAGGVTLTGLRAIRDVLELHNYTLQHISVFTPDEQDNVSSPSSQHHTTTRRLLSAIRRRLASHGLEEDEDTSFIGLGGGRSSSDDDNVHYDEEEYYRLQHQMEIYCRLNRLGRGTLLSPRTSADEWIETLAVFCADNNNNDVGSDDYFHNDDSNDSTGAVGSSSWLTASTAAAAASAFPSPPTLMARKSSGLVRRSDGLVDVGLNEIFILLRTHPTLCDLDHSNDESRRSLHTLIGRTSAGRGGGGRATSLPLTMGLSQQERANSFKNLVAPPTTINKALAIQWRKKRKKKREQLLRQQQQQQQQHQQNSSTTRRASHDPPLHEQQDR